MGYSVEQSLSSKRSTHVLSYRIIFAFKLKYFNSRLLATWPVLQEPTRALELLKPRFIDRKIREYTVKNLQLVSDTELADYLLQLVQVSFQKKVI